MGAKVADDHIASVDFDVRPFRAVGESGTVYTADSVVVSTGVFTSTSRTGNDRVTS